MNEETKTAESVSDVNENAAEDVMLDHEIESDAEDTASRLHEMVKSASEEAKLEKLAMPSPKTARLTYSAYADMRPANTSVYAPARTGTYFWLLVLTSIPVIGYIIAVIAACASKKLAVKRFLTAVIMAQTLILLVIAALVCVAVFAYKIDLVGYFKEILPLLKECVAALK